MALLSIITINFNNYLGLQQTIMSVLNSTFKDFEYILIDGGSTDGSKAVIEKNAARINYWVSEKDSGIYNAMNKGIARATGEYLLFLNSGDYIKDDFVIKKCFEKKIEADVLYGNLEMADRVVKYPKKLDFTFFFRDSIPHPAAFIKRNLFISYGMYNEKNKIVSDWQFFLEAIIVHKCTYAKIEETISVYDVNGISGNSAFAQLQLNERIQILTPMLQEHYPNILQNFTILENELNLYKNSRIISSLKKIMNNKLYQFFKRIS